MVSQQLPARLIFNAGRLPRFTTDKLLGFLKRLDRKVTIQISRDHPGEPYHEVGFGL